MRRLLALFVVMNFVGFNAKAAVGETWSCAVNEKIGGAQIQQYRVEGKKLKELTSDKLMREWAPSTNNFLGAEYDILHNDKDVLIAESDYAGLDEQKAKEVYVVNIIITKNNGNLLLTSILTHLPAPNEIGTVYGSCTAAGD